MGRTFKIAMQFMHSNEHYGSFGIKDESMHFSPHARIDKLFIAPFLEENYFRLRSYEDIFNAVDKQLQRGDYLLTMYSYRIMPTVMYNEPPAIMPKSYRPGDAFLKHLQNANLSEKELNDLLVNSIHCYPRLFEIKSPVAEFLVSHFSKLLRQAVFSRNSKERSDALSVIRDRILERPKSLKKSHKAIPNTLYLRAFRDYLHQITIDIRQNLLKHQATRDGTIQNITHMKRIDPRLKYLDDKNLLKDIQSRNWKTVTSELLAEFLGLSSIEGLDQKLKKETREVKKAWERMPADEKKKIEAFQRGMKIINNIPSSKSKG